MRTLVLLVAVLALNGCKPRAYECNIDMECTASNGGYGRCLPGSALELTPKYCAFVDSNCASGLRFDDTAGDYAEDCVDPAVTVTPDGGPVDAPPGTPDGTPLPPIDGGLIDAGAPTIDASPALPDAAP